MDDTFARSGQQKAARVVRFAHGQVKAMQHGAIKEFEQRIGMGHGFLTNRKDEGDLKLSTFFSLAEFLEIPPDELISDSLDGEGEKELRLARLAPGRPLPELVARAYERLNPEEEMADQVSLVAQLEHLDELRYEDPARALAELKSLIPSLPSAEVLRFLGVGASCYRLLFHFGTALQCLEAARQIALLRGDRSAVGDVYQRAVYVLQSMDRGDRAMAAAQQATLIYSRLGGSAKIGESLLEQAYCHSTNHRLDKALEFYLDAHRYLDQMSPRCRVACLQGIGSMLTKLGRAKEALPYLEAAKACVPLRNPMMTGKLLWLSALTKASLEQPGAAQDAARAVDLLLPKYPVDAALCSVDLAGIFLQTGQPHLAHATARDMIRFIDREPLRRIRAAQEGLRDLIVIGEASRGLTLQHLRQTAVRILDGKKRYLHSLPL